MRERKSERKKERKKRKSERERVKERKKERKKTGKKEGKKERKKREINLYRQGETRKKKIRNKTRRQKTRGRTAPVSVAPLVVAIPSPRVACAARPARWPLVVVAVLRGVPWQAARPRGPGMLKSVKKKKPHNNRQYENW